MPNGRVQMGLGWNRACVHDQIRGEGTCCIVNASDEIIG